MNRLALELLALVSPTPRPALAVAEALDVPISGRGGGTLRGLVRQCRQARLGVHLATGRHQAVGLLLPSPPDPTAAYVWCDAAAWPRVQSLAVARLAERPRGIPCRWCGETGRHRTENVYDFPGRKIRRRVCLACGKPTLTEERPLAGGRIGVMGI